MSANPTTVPGAPTGDTTVQVFTGAIPANGIVLSDGSVLELKSDSDGLTLTLTTTDADGNQNVQTSTLIPTSLARTVAPRLSIANTTPPQVASFPTLPPSLLKRMTSSETLNWNDSVTKWAGSVAASLVRWGTISLKPSGSAAISKV
jgi:hypothetical protein